MKNQAAFLAHVYNYISIYTLRSVFAPSTNALSEIGKRQFAASIKFFISTSDNSTWHSQISSVKKQSKTRIFVFFFSHRLHNYPERHTFASFFMVLDLRLVKIGCRETINFFVFIHPYPQRKNFSTAQESSLIPSSFFGYHRLLR